MREYLEGSDEESLWLSAAAIDAIRFVEGLANPHSSVTESRLAILIQALNQLSLDSDKDAARKLANLREERKQLDIRIEALERGEVKVITNLEATERIREILVLGIGLTEDFARVQENFKDIHQSLREKYLQSTEEMTIILDHVFKDIRHIDETDAGRTFKAFYTLLNDEVAKLSFKKSLEVINKGEFFQLLTSSEMYFLKHFIQILFTESLNQNNTTMRFSESLSALVKSREFRERRLLNTLLKESLKAASIISSHIPLTKTLDFHLKLSTSHVDSASRLTLLDYQPDDVPQPIKKAESVDLDLDMVLISIQGDEIDFDALLENVMAVLELLPKASIGDVLYHFPASEGLASVVGLMHLAHRYGEREGLTETVHWLGLDDVFRSASIEKWYFYREKMKTLAL
jgi:hypothetical protein